MIFISGVIYTGCQSEEDITPPIITLTGDNPFYMDLNDSYAEPGFTVKDDEDGTIPNSKVTVTTNVDKDHTGTYTVTYKVTDNAGNTGMAERSVAVRNSADFLSGTYTNCSNSCQTTPVNTFNAEIHGSDTENGKFFITNFGGFGNTVTIECSYNKNNNQISATTGQSLGGTVVLESLNIASVTNNANPVEFFINYNWRDGVVGDVCNATYSK